MTQIEFYFVSTCVYSGTVFFKVVRKTDPVGVSWADRLREMEAVSGSVCTLHSPLISFHCH